MGVIFVVEQQHDDGVWVAAGATFWRCMDEAERQARQWQEATGHRVLYRAERYSPWEGRTAQRL